MTSHSDPYSWNDSLLGDFLWTKTNFGEAVPDVMTPATRSIFAIYDEEVMPFHLTGDYPAIGNVGGRLYFNIGLIGSIARALGFSAQRMAEESAGIWGSLPVGAEFPAISLSRWSILRQILGPALRIRLRINREKKEIDSFMAGAPALYDRMVGEIDGLASAGALVAYWETTLEASLRRACRMLQIATAAGTDPAVILKRKLTKLLGASEAAALISDFSTESETLASMQPLLGLAQVVLGELSREAYIRRFGHRGSHEMELSFPHPADDPVWLDSQLEQLKVYDPLALMAEQRSRRVNALTDLRRLPKEALAIEKELAAVAAGSRLREQTRSEVVRLFGVARPFVQKVGALTGLGDDAFHLTLLELSRLLAGESALADFIPARKEMYAQLRALPSYPAVIRGKFDPFTWAAVPQRRLDFYDGNQPVTAAAPTSNLLRGTGGCAGIAEGIVRVLHTPEESSAFQSGEILVAHITNVGWTPLFPRAAAVVTDVGAVLSHAAIVARELGIPAVVGTGDATIRLKTGDRVRVDGLAGTVTKIEGRKGGQEEGRKGGREEGWTGGRDQ